MSFNIFILKRFIFVIAFLGISTQKITFEFSRIAPGKPTELAVIAREFARGNGLTTKIQTPANLSHMERNNYSKSLFTNLPNTSYAPLYPMFIGSIFKIIGLENLENKWVGEDRYYLMDLIIAITNTLFFFAAIVCSYFLVYRLFTHVIAGLVCIIISLSPIVWSTILQGGGDSMVFFFFTYSMFMLLKAFETEKTTFYGLISVGLMFCAVLTDWIAIWPYLGLMLSALLLPKGHGLIQSVGWGGLVIFVSIQAYTNISVTGSFFGMAILDVIPSGNTNEAAAALSNLTITNGLVKLILLSFITNIYESLSLMGLSQAGFFLAPCFIFCLFHTYKRSSLNSYKYVTVIVSLIVLIGVGSLNSFTNGVASGMILFITSPLIIAFSVTTLVIVITQGAIDRRTGQFWVSWIVIALAFVPFTKNLIDSVKNIPSKTDFITSDARLKELVGNNIIISDSPNDTAWYADIHSVLAPTNILMVNNIRQKALNEGLEIKGLHFTEKSIFNLNTFGQTVRYNTYFILVAYPVISTYMPDLMPDYSNIHTSTGFSQPINLVTNYRIYYPFSNE